MVYPYYEILAVKHLMYIHIRKTFRLFKAFITYVLTIRCSKSFGYIIKFLK